MKSLLGSTFFRRLFLPYLLLIGGAVAVVGLLAANRLRETYIERTRQRLSDDSALVVRLVAANLSPGHESQLRQQTAELGKLLQCRMTVIDEAGIVIADNEADPAQMENHRMRPEIIAAISQGQGYSVRPSATIHLDLLYFARRFGEGPSAHIVRLAVHLKDLDEQLALLYRGLAITAVMAVLVAGALGYYFALRNSGPILELTDFANTVAHGDLSRRIVSNAPGELHTLAVALNSMADSLSRLFLDSEQDKAELRAILTSMSEGVLATDAQLRILMFNPAAATLFDIDTQMEGKLLWEVMRYEPMLRAAVEVLEGGQSTTFQLEPAIGRYLEITACPFESSRTRGLIIVAHDTTQSVRYQDFRKEFVANVSHELRTPLTAIKGYAETLQSGAVNDPEKAQQYLGTIQKHTDQLTNLVSDLLDLAKLERRSEPSQHISVDLAELVPQAVEIGQAAAAKRKQNFSWSVDRDVPPIMGVPDYLERAIANLVENAIKYTPEGGRITLTVKRQNESVVIDVADNGIGIPPQDLSRIFERFYRVDRSRSREMGGTGLGLSIVKHVAQTHGGRVDVSSTPGKGSTFSLVLPLMIA